MSSDREIIAELELYIDGYNGGAVDIPRAILQRAVDELTRLQAPSGDEEEVAKRIAHEFVNSFGVEECIVGVHSIWCLKLTAAIATALRARDGEVERLVRSMRHAEHELEKEEWHDALATIRNALAALHPAKEET